MRTLYVASKAAGDADLNLAREITELQRRFGAASAEPVEFHILPDIKIESLPGELSRFRPDILHIASHADKQSLSLSDEKGNQVKVTAKMLGAFLPPEHPPRIIYLNSCDSKQIAKELVNLGFAAMAIGSTAPITNRAARAAAVAFYERLLAGLSVARAYVTARGMLEAVMRSKASMELFPLSSKQARTEIINPVPELVADVSSRIPNEDGYGFRLGLYGSPASTAQVIFFTDDETFIKDEDTFENDLSLVVRTSPVSGMLWAEKNQWRAIGDHRLFAVGVRAGAGCFVVESTLCQALENRYRLAGKALPSNVSQLVERLRRNNGADLNPVTWDSRKSANRTKSKKSAKKPSAVVPANKR